MDEKKIFMGAGALVLVLFLIAVFTTGGDSGDTAENLIADGLDPVKDSVSALETRIGEMQSAVDAQISEVKSALDGQVADLQGQIDALSSQAAGAVSSDDLAAVQSQVEELAASGAATLAAVAAVATPAAEAEASEADAPTAPAATAASTSGGGSDASGTGVGETLVLADGAMRVFVSRVTEDSARVSVDSKMIPISVGHSRAVQAGENACLLTLNSVSDGAAFDAVCGDGIPKPAGLSAGETAVFADGAMRVFVSRVTENGARLSVAGENVSLGYGDTGEVMVGDASCTLSLENIDRGHVTVSSGC